MSLIYKTINLVNNKIYIGQTNNKSISYIGGGSKLKKAINKYKKENFIRETIVDNIYCQDTLDFLEEYFIALYDSCNPLIGYNIHKGGKGNTEAQNKRISTSNTGKKLSEETKEKLRKAKLGSKASEETKKKFSEQRKGNQFRKGMPILDDHKIKISEGLKLHHQSNPQTRERQRESSLKHHKENPNFKKMVENNIKNKLHLKGSKIAQELNKRPIRITNIITEEIIEKESVKACKEYFQIKGTCDLTNALKRNKLYKKIYKLEYIIK